MSNKSYSLKFKFDSTLQVITQLYICSALYQSYKCEYERENLSYCNGASRGGGTMQCHQNHHVKAPFRLGNEKSGVN